MLQEMKWILLEKIMKDVDFRLTAIEQKNAVLAKVEEDSRAENVVLETENKPIETVEALDASGQYEKAFEFLRNAEYAKAEKSLRAFIAEHCPDW